MVVLAAAPSEANAALEGADRVTVPDTADAALEGAGRQTNSGLSDEEWSGIMAGKI